MTKDKNWNYRPEGKVKTSPLFSWPLNPKAIALWFAAYWLVLSTTTLALVVAFGSYWIFLPPLEQMRHLEWGWIFRIWLAVLIPHCLCAGLLHYWLYMHKGQGLIYKYYERGQVKDNGTFSFRNQVHDNMFWTIVSGITQSTIYQVIMFWALANGWVPFASFATSPIWFLALFFLIPIWSSFHFYWVHRWLHWPPLYKLAHSLHHRNVNVGPWSGISMHPIEHLIYFTTYLVHFLVPTHPMHLLFHNYMQTLHPIFSHSGFDKLLIADKDHAQIGDFFHQLHHRYFECNYGTVEMPWDKWFGSFHDGSDEATQETRRRKKQMYT